MLWGTRLFGEGCGGAGNLYPRRRSAKGESLARRRLGFKPFCERLAKVIANLRVPNGYVIGLHGEWGSGKSTALNFVRRFLEKHNQECEDKKERLTLVDFRPWIVSGHQDLVAAFFKVISESLDRRPGWRKLQLRRLMRFLQISADPLVDAVAKVAVTVDPSAGVASGAAAIVTKKSLGATVNKFLEEPSLQSAYEDLKTKLSANGKRFLVTIDDLDRLQDEEIRSIMQMVKTVGRLPNVIYLFAYDQSIVWEALDGHLERAGPRFAEKIMQQEIELPRPSKESLLAVLDEEIAFLNEHVHESSLRWNYIVRDGVRRWVRHPRDALRLANAVKFSWPALRGEIDAADLLAMEGLRLFDAEVFELDSVEQGFPVLGRPLNDVSRRDARYGREASEGEPTGGDTRAIVAHTDGPLPPPRRGVRRQKKRGGRDARRHRGAARCRLRGRIRCVLRASPVLRRDPEIDDRPDHRQLR